MASQTLVTAAEKMYKSEFSTTDYTKLLDPAVTAMKENIAEQKRITDDLMGQKPIFNIYGVDEKLRPTVTAWLVEQNEKYKNAADVVGRIKDTKDPRYIKAVQEMNEVNSAFLNLKNDVDGLETQMGDAFDNKDNLAGGLNGTHHEHDMHLFANGGIYDKIIEQGIGVDGRLSYLSGEMTDAEEIKNLETELAKIEDKNSVEAITLIQDIKDLKEGRVGIVKKIKDYKGSPKHNTDNVSLVLAVQQQIMNNATSGMVWDENSTELAVDQIINQMKPDGVRDFMFKHKTYIDGYIENTFGFEKGSPEFENKKEELRTEDLTDEFREHFLNQLENDHKKYYKPPKGDKFTPPTVVTYVAKGGATYTFEKEPTTRTGNLEFQLVKEVLDGRTVVRDRVNKITYTLGDGPEKNKYYPVQEHEALEDGSGPDLTKPLPRIGYTADDLIYNFGGLMQPAEVWNPNKPTVEEPSEPVVSNTNPYPGKGWWQTEGTNIWNPPIPGLGNNSLEPFPSTGSNSEYQTGWKKGLSKNPKEGKYYSSHDGTLYIVKNGEYRNLPSN